ncbi:hypothetical protein ACQP2U_26045 [Nocardia sp. CA-084685]|uniref:hypothetical protein n=1 Tax=Nocardia sp. CA-084685 TaxID=3239970 RepID=UPI003D96A644
MLRAITQAAIVSEDFARILGQFGVEQRADIADHLDGLSGKGLRLPSSIDARSGDDVPGRPGHVGAGRGRHCALTDEQAIEGLTRFIYRGLTGRDY